jgi:hypothetical protein
MPTHSFEALKKVKLAVATEDELKSKVWDEDKLLEELEK